MIGFGLSPVCQSGDMKLLSGSIVLSMGFIFICLFVALSGCEFFFFVFLCCSGVFWLMVCGGFLFGLRPGFEEKLSMAA